MKDVSVSANATLYSLSRSVNRLSSHVLLRISTTNRQVGKSFTRFRKKRKRRGKSSYLISDFINRGKWDNKRPHLSFRQPHPAIESSKFPLQPHQHLLLR